jgi:hypothetical protein
MLSHMGMMTHFRRLRKGLVWASDFALGLVEMLILAGVPDKSVSTIWIVAPPRSGTTLLFQALIRRYDLAYISNFAAMSSRAPVVASWMANRLFKSHERIAKFQSNYGRTADWLGPHEAGSFMYRWFPKGDHVYVPPGSICQEQLKYFKREVIGLSQVFEAPVLFKNVYNSMRIAPIIETFPNSCFLVCRRDPLDTAQSILNGRMKLYDDKTKWMGVPPKEIDQIKELPYWDQVAEQIYYTYRQIEADERRYGSDKFFDVHYEQLCKNPHAVLLQMERFFSVHNIKLRTVGELPEQFPFSAEQQVDDRDYQLLRQAVVKLWP